MNLACLLAPTRRNLCPLAACCLVAAALTPSLAHAEDVPATRTSPPPTSDAPPAHRVRIGPSLTLLGLNSLVGGGVSIEPHPLVETGIWAGYNAASVESVTGSARATASISAVTIAVRTRLWILARHSPVLDLGLGTSLYSVSADASDDLGNSLSYRRSGPTALGAIGAGYGFRTEAGFRLVVLAGALAHGKLPTSTLQTKGAFSPTDAVSLRHDLDTDLDGLGKPRLYLDLSVGWLF